MTKQENNDNRHRPNVPPLRFRGFTDPWQRKPLGELFVLRNGYTPSKSNPIYWENGDIPWFRMEDIREQGRILGDAIQHVTKAAVKGAGLFPKDSFILSTTATIGEHAWLTTDALANQQFTILCTANRWDSLDIKYFHQYCFHLGDWCRRNVNVGGLNAVNIDGLREHQIPFPSLAEQEKIGSFFRALDELIAAREEELEKLRQMKAALLDAMFPSDAPLERVASATAHTLYDNLLDHTLQAWDIVPTETSTPHTPRLRFRGFTDPWQRTDLKDVCSIKTGELDANAMVEDGAYPFFTCAKQTYKTDTYAFSGEAVLIAGNGEVGLTKYYNGKFNAYQRTYVLQSSRNDIVLRFILNHIEYGLPKRIAPLLFGSAMPYITLNTLNDMPIYVPSLAEQKQIDAFFRSQDEGIATATEQIDKLKRIKQACLKQMFV